MRLCLLVALATLALGCKKKPAILATDAGITPVAVASSRSLHDAGVAEASAPPPLPLASDKLELVAVGKSGASKVIWLQANGERVWLSGHNLDAFADGDGPLAKGPDLLAKLDYKPGEHAMRVVGAWPHLFLLRTKKTSYRWDSSEATVFVYTVDAGAGTWTKAKKLSLDGYPWAFIAFRDGALVVNSQNEGNAWPGYSGPKPGTTTDFVGPDGTVSDPKLGIPTLFMAWSASADNGVVSLLGATGRMHAAPSADAPIDGIDLVRITPDGVKTVRVQPRWDGTWSYWSKVVERDGTTLIAPPHDMGQEGWKPTSMTHFVLDGDKLKPLTVGGGEGCSADSSLPVGDAIYTMRQCMSDAVPGVTLVRLGGDGKTTKVVIPPIVSKTAKEGGGFRAAHDAAEAKTHGHACVPKTMTLRGKSDLWVAATCGQDSIPAVYRLGRPQEPVLLP